VSKMRLQSKGARLQSFRPRFRSRFCSEKVISTMPKIKKSHLHIHQPVPKIQGPLSLILRTPGCGGRMIICFVYSPP
jgi:hypothetical protein